MAQRERRLTDALYDEVTGTGQIRVMPRWLMKPLEIIAPDSIQDAGIQLMERRALVRKAVSAFRQLTRREGRQMLASVWQISPDGTQAVRVLQQVAELRQQKSLLDLGRQIQMTTLNHPGLAPLVEMAFYETYPYVVARLRAGARPLSTETGQPMEHKRAFRLINQVGEALQYLHYRGLYHGALSPDDIFVDESGLPLVAGVGVEQVRRLLEITTQPPPTALTPPEVAQGAAPDTRSDVYALAALAYLLITGKPPVPGRPTHLARDYPALPPILDTVLTKALAAQPEERYTNLIDMNRALRPAMHEARAASRRPPREPITATEPGSARRRQQAPERPRPEAAAEATASSAGFPEPLPFPDIDTGVLEEALAMPEIAAIEAIEIPSAPEIPNVDWETLLKPLNLTELLPELDALLPRTKPAPAPHAAPEPPPSSQRPPAKQASRPAHETPPPRQAPPKRKRRSPQP